MMARAGDAPDFSSLQARLKGALLRGMERRRVELRAAAAKLPRLETLFQVPQQRFDRAGERLNAALRRR